jgi:hypothetical protein
MGMDSRFDSLALRFSKRLQERSRELATYREQKVEPPLSRQLSDDVVQGKTPLQPREVEQPATPVSEALAQAEEMAALSGLFSPETLLSGDIDPELRRQVLSALSKACFVTATGKSTQWFMLADARKVALQRLHESDLLNERLSSPSLPATDGFGKALREVLASGSNVPLDRSLPELLQLSRAIDALAPAGVVSLPDANEVRRSIARATFMSEFDTLVGRGFFGRAGELRQLHKFVGESVADKPKLAFLDFDMLEIRGVGGSGKSALLVRFLKEILEQKRITIAVLDFDRPGVDAVDTEWLEFELTRQVGYQLPALDRPLREAREGIRGDRASLYAGSAANQEFESARRSSRSVVGILGKLLARQSDRSNIFLLVLDTFERVMERDLAPKLIDWLREISNALHPVRLKVIVAGRLYERGQNELGSSATAPAVDLGPLRPRDAARLLKSLKVPEERADRIARSGVIPLRPLELKLLARLLLDQPDTDIAQIEQDLRNGGPAAAALFSGVIYRRVLQRLQSKRSQAIAYPGLTLRFITPEIIQKVLVPALGLEPLSDEEAGQTLEELASHEWLVTRDEAGAIWHRRDLRRSTLQAMIADERRRETDRAQKIHAEALRFFGSQDDEKSQAEHLYHRLMLADSAANAAGIDIRLIRALARYIEADAADWPAAARVLFNHANRKSLSVEDLRLLPEQHRDDAYQKVGVAFTRAREFGQAWKLLSDRDALLGRAPSRGPPRLTHSWEVETAFVTAHWETLRKVDPELIHDSSPSTMFFLSMKSPGEPLSGFPWRIRISQRRGSRMTGVADLEFRRIAAIGVLTGRKATPELRKPIDALGDLGGYEKLSPALQRRWYLARRALGRIDHASVSLTPEFVCLRREWMRSFGQLYEKIDTDGRASSLVHNIADVMERGGSRSARRLLAEVDGLFGRGRAERPVNAPQIMIPRGVRFDSLIRLLAGPNPEFRDVTRFALLNAFPGEDGHRALAMLIDAQLDMRLPELPSGRFTMDMADDAERTMKTYIELLDRSWRLGNLLESALARAGKSHSQLSDVLASYRRWEHAVTEALERK